MVPTRNQTVPAPHTPRPSRIPALTPPAGNCLTPWSTYAHLDQWSGALDPRGNRHGRGAVRYRIHTGPAAAGDEGLAEGEYLHGAREGLWVIRLRGETMECLYARDEYQGRRGAAAAPAAPPSNP